MFELRQFDLKLAFRGTGALREDVQDKCGTVHHPAGEMALEVALLHRREAVIHQDKVRGVSLHAIADFVGLAGTDKKLWIRAITVGSQAGYRFDPRGQGQLMEL